MFVAWGPARTLLFNDGYAPMLGSREAGALGRPFFDVWPEVQGEVGALMDRVFAGEPVHMDDLQLTLHRNGAPEEAHFAFSYTPVRGKAGTVTGLFCACLETTGQVMAERALTAERDRAQGVLDNMGDAFVLLDRELRIVDMNAEAMRLERRPREAILGRRHEDAHPDAAPELAVLYRQATRERRPVTLEHRYVWPDGRETWIDMRAYPADEGLAVFYRDVTDAKRAEAELRALNADLERQVAERAQARGRTWTPTPDLMGVINRQGVFEESNPAWAAVLGWSGAEVASGRSSTSSIPTTSPGRRRPGPTPSRGDCLRCASRTATGTRRAAGAG